MRARDKIIERFTWTYYAFIVAGLVVFFTIVFISTFERKHFKKQQIAITDKTIEATRGNIYDINGRLLATSVIKYDIRWDTKTEYLRDEIFYKYIDSISVGLAKILKDRTAEEYKTYFINQRNGQNPRDVKIVNDIDFSTYKKIRQLPIFKESRNRGGIKVTKKRDRKLLHGNLGRRIIGFKNSKNEYLGIEYMMNATLSGTDGIAKVKRLGNGNYDIIKSIKDPTDGDDIITTIDINMQDIVDKALRKQLIETDADFGVAILMDVQTGAIRAVANLSKVDSAVYIENKNHAISSRYEPGSVMKLASFMNAFEEDNTLTPNKLINTHNGILNVNGFKFTDYKKGGFGTISAQKVFELSSNVGTVEITYSTFKNKKQKFLERYSDYYFDKKLGLKLDNEIAPYIQDNSSAATLGQLAIGYQIALTPMHIITFYNAVANNGKMVKPMFVSSIVRDGQVIEQMQPVVLNNAVCSQKTLDYCKTMLEGVVEHGTGEKYVKSDLVKIAGKSGTAQIYMKDIGYTPGTINATFVAYFPADKPKYTCLVWISNPQKNKSGSHAAGPVIKEIAEEIYTFDYDLHNKQFVINDFKNIQSVPKVKNGITKNITRILDSLKIKYAIKDRKGLVAAKSLNASVELRPIVLKKNAMPDVVGMNIKDAVFILGNTGLDIDIKGEGKVIKQSIAKNTEIKKNQKVVLTLG